MSEIVTDDELDTSSTTITMLGGRTIKPWFVLLSVIFGVFMSLLDTTITNIALDSIRTNLKTDLTAVSWVIDAYTLTFAVLLVTMGRFADQFGRKKIFMLGMGIFSLGSLLCAIAPTIELLIAFRVVQAFGASVIEAVSLAIILAVFPKDKRGAAVGIWGALSGLAAAIGPVLGGALLELGKGSIEWRGIFLVNLPFCIVGLVMIARFVPEIRDTNATRRIDILGLLTLTAGMVCLALALTEGSAWGWTSIGILGLFVGSVTSLILFYGVETRQTQPILDFSVFTVRSFTAACLVIIMTTIALQGALVIAIQYFVMERGQSALNAAFSILPLPAAGFVTAVIASQIGHRFDARFKVTLGMILMGTGLLSLYTLTLSAEYVDTLWRLSIIGSGMALCFVTLPTVALSQVPNAKLGAGSGAYNTFSQLGFVIGVAVFISLFTGQIDDQIASAKIHAIQTVQATQSIPEQAKAQVIARLQQSSGGAPQLDASPLSNQITTLFSQAMLDSFKVVWFAAAMVALFGIFPALFTGAPKRSPVEMRQNIADDEEELRLAA